MKLRPSGRADRVRQSRAGFRCLLAEVLERRDLLATLNVGPGEDFATIQAAVNNARVGDEIAVADGTYSESVDLSLMGSALGRSPGNLRIRGTGPAVVVESPGGPAFRNSSAFSGNLTLDRLTLRSSTSTAAADSGVHLDGYSGNLRLTNILVENTQDTGITIRNASGLVRIQDSEVSDAGEGAGDHGIELSQVTGTAVIADSVVRDVSDDGIVVSLGGSGQLVALVTANGISGDPVAFGSTNQGIRLEARGQARLSAVVENNTMDDMDESAMRVLVQDNARFEGRLDGNIVFNANDALGTDVRVEDTAEAAFSYSENTISDTRAGGMRLSLGDSANVNAYLRNNLFFNVGDGAGDDGLVITSDSGSSGRLNAFLNFNDFVTVQGAGAVINGQGSTTFNITASENSFSDVNKASGTAAVLIAKANSTTQAVFNLDFVDNTVNQSVQGAFRFEQRGSGAFRLEGSEADAKTQIESTNTGVLEVTGSISLAPIGIFDESVPLLLGDLIWNDANGNGIYENETEDGLGAVVVSLTGTEASGGAAVQRTTISDFSGQYQFSGLLPGEYSLRLEPLFGFSLVASGQGDDATRDSDFNRSTRDVAVTLVENTDQLDVDAGLVRNWQNPILPVDVNDDGVVAPVDVLIVINDLNTSNARPLPIPDANNDPPPYLDVNGDTLVAPVDVLQVINFLNAGGGGEGEGDDLAISAENSPAIPDPFLGRTPDRDAWLEPSGWHGASGPLRLATQLTRTPRLELAPRLPAAPGTLVVGQLAEGGTADSPFEPRGEDWEDLLTELATDDTRPLL